MKTTAQGTVIGRKENRRSEPKMESDVGFFCCGLRPRFTCPEGDGGKRGEDGDETNPTNGSHHPPRFRRDATRATMPNPAKTAVQLFSVALGVAEHPETFAEASPS